MQAIIDERIRCLKLQAVYLKRERNSLSLVGVLPSEILGRIFWFAASCPDIEVDHVWLSSELENERLPTTRFNFSFVSHHWRVVSIATPRIWSKIPHKNPSWMRTCLERSKMVGIALNRSITAPIFTSAVASVFDGAVRAYNLRIKEIGLHFILSPMDAQQALNKLPASAPYLRTLRIGFHRRPIFGGPTIQPHISPELMTDACLDVLELYGCSIAWNSPLLSGLTTFKIGPLATYPPSSQLTNALQQMPTLQVLELNNVLPARPFDGHAALTLPCLRRLRILSDIERLGAWIAALSVSASTKVQLCCIGSEVDALLGREQLESMALCLNEFFRRMITSSRTPRYDSLNILQGATHRIAFEAWTTRWPSDSPWHRDDDVDFAIKFQGVQTMDIAMHCMVPILPLLQLTTLSLMIDNEVQEATISSIFLSYSELNTVFVDRHTAPIMIRALQPRFASEESSKGSQSLPLPSLRSLWISQPHFLANQDLGLTLHSLQTFLRCRNHNHGRLKELVLSEASGIGSDDIMSLCGLVDKLRWDLCPDTRDIGFAIRRYLQDQEDDFDGLTFF